MAMEELAKQDKMNLEELTDRQLDQLWNTAKRQEKEEQMCNKVNKGWAHHENKDKDENDFLSYIQTTI